MRGEGHWNVYGDVNLESKHSNLILLLKSALKFQNTDFKNRPTKNSNSVRAIFSSSPNLFMSYMDASLHTSNQVSTFWSLVIVVLLCSLKSQITNPLMLEWCSSAASESWAVLRSNQQGKVLWSPVEKASSVSAMEMILCRVAALWSKTLLAFALLLPHTLVLGYLQKQPFQSLFPCDNFQRSNVRLEPLYFNTHRITLANCTC